MAQRSTADIQVVCIGGWELRPYLTRIGMGWMARTEDDTKLGHDFVRFAPTGVYHNTLEMAGTFDDGASGLAGAVASLNATTQPALVGCCGNTMGATMFGFEKYTQAQFRTEFQKGDFVKASAQAEGVGESDKVMRCIIPLADHDETFVLGTILNESALFPSGSTLGGYLHVQIVSLVLDGATKITVGIKTGDGVTMAACTGLSPNGEFTAARGAKRIHVPAQTLGTHMQATVAWTGTPGPNAAVRLVAAWERTVAA